MSLSSHEAAQLRAVGDRIIEGRADRYDAMLLEDIATRHELEEYSTCRASRRSTKAIAPTR